VNHHTIRDIIVDAYQIADESLLGEMIRTQDAKINNINRSTSVGTVAEQDRFKQTIDYQQKRIDELDKELRHNRARIKELEPDLDSK
jgi:predicted RNase H-like nuclease (RuvC/YqgF family)